MRVLAFLSMGFLAVSAETYFKEKFDDGWKKRWVVSENWKSNNELGKWGHTAGQWYGDAKDKGIQVSSGGF